MSGSASQGASVKTSDIMTVGVATIQESDSLLRAVELLCDHHISALPVLDDAGNLTGILTEGDFLRMNGFHLATVLAKPYEARRRELETSLVREVMTHDCISTGPDTSLYDTIVLMDERGLKRLPVVAEGKLVGLLSRSDLLRALVQYK
jgi:CBS-domain-containing membrane protein